MDCILCNRPAQTRRKVWGASVRYHIWYGDKLHEICRRCARTAKGVLI